MATYDGHTLAGVDCNGSYANRPARGNDGQLYYANDTQAMYVWDSLTAAWIAFGTTGTTVTTLAGKTLTHPTISAGLAAVGSASNDFSGSTGAFKTSTGTNTFGGTASTLAFFGSTGTTQPAGASQASVAPTATTMAATGSPTGTQYNALVTDVTNLATLTDALRAALVSLALVKGGA
jgi:hypothetical protein